MKTFVKIVGVIFLVIVALVVALPFILPTEFLFKQVTQSVEQTTGRQLVISGKKSLSVFPQLKLELNDVAFANIEQGSKPHMATMDQLSIHIPYLSVLSGDIKLDKFVIQNPDIVLEKLANGNVNWQLFAQTSQTNTDTEQPESGGEGKGLPEGLDIQLGEVAIYGGSITYIDHQNSTQQTLSDLALAIQLPSLRQNLTVAGTLTYLAEIFELELTVTTPEKVLSEQDFNIASKLDSRLVKFGFDGAIAKKMTDFSGQMTLTGDSVKELANWLKQPLEAKENAFNAFAVDAQMHFANENLELNDLTAKLDALAITGNANINLQNKLNITANIDLGMLNVNPYLPETGKSPEETRQQKDETSAQPIVWDTTPIDLSALNSVDTEIKIAATGFQFKEIKLGQTELSLALNNGKATLALNKFNAYQGTGNGQVIVNALRRPYTVNTAFTLEGIQAESLLSDAVDFNKLMGQGGINIALNMKGQSQKDFVESLHGTTRFSFADGAIKGANIAAMVRSAEKLINGGGLDAKGLEQGFDNAQATDFSELVGQFTFNQGVSTQNDVSLKSPLIRLTGNGEINMPSTHINYRLVTGIVGSIEGQGTEDTSTGFKVPIRIKGPFHKVSIKPDIGDAAKEKAKDKIKDTLKQFFG